MSLTEKPDVVMVDSSKHTSIDVEMKSAGIETLHNDEGVKVLATYDGDLSWEPAEEKRLVRKIDRSVLVILCLTYGLQWYDKGMLSQAAIFGLREDLGLDIGNRYSFSASIFYLGFIAGAYPAIVLAQRFPIERVAAGIVGVWGACVMCTPACTNYRGFYAQRFFLGFLESGVSPMFMLIVGSWYTRKEQALRMGAWYSFTGWAATVSPLINYGLGHIKGSLSPWHYMYICAGGITIFWSAVIFFCLPPDPVRAKSLNEREKYIAVARLRTNNTGVRNTHVKKSQVWELLRDPKFWLMFSMAFLMEIANAPASTFIPIIIKSFGYSTLNSLLLAMPLGFIIGCFELLASYAAMKIPNVRSYIYVMCQSVTVMAALLLWQLPFTAKGGLLLGCYTISFFGAGYAVLMGMQIANTAGYTKRSAASSGIFIGFCLGNFIGPLLFKESEAPRYGPAWAAVVATSTGAALLCLCYRLICSWENRKRDNTGTLEGFEHAYEDDLTDKK